MESQQQSVRTAQALKAHLALNVRSVERSLEFYRRMLGLERTEPIPEINRRGDL